MRNNKTYQSWLKSKFFVHFITLYTYPTNQIKFLKKCAPPNAQYKLTLTKAGKKICLERKISKHGLAFWHEI